MQAAGESIYRATISVVARVGDELIVERDFRRVRDGIAVTDFDDLFEPVIGQCAVADQDSQSTSGEVGLMVRGKTIDDAGNRRSYRPGLPQFLQLIETPPETVRSTSVGGVQRLGRLGAL